MRNVGHGVSLCQSIIALTKEINWHVLKRPQNAQLNFCKRVYGT